MLADGIIRRCAADGALTGNEARLPAPVLLAALSGDSRYLAVVHGKPVTLSMLSANDLRILKSLELRGLAKQPLEPVQLVDAAPRKSIVAIMRDGLEAWEILYGANAPPVYDGFVHDYRSGEGIAASGPFPVRRIALGLPIGPALFEPAFDYLIAAEGRERLVILNLNVRRIIAHIDVVARHLPETGASWRDAGGSLYAIPATDGSIALIGSRTWMVERRTATPAPAAGVKHDASTGTLWLWYGDERVNSRIDVLSALDLAPIATLTVPQGESVSGLRIDREAQITVLTPNGRFYVYDAATRQRIGDVGDAPPDCGVTR